MTMVNKETKWAQPVRNFFSTTTLHGFKYLLSAYYMDRVAWLICCCASTCCAGLLFTVLWTRFLEVPAVLQLWDLHTLTTDTQLMPLVALCPPADVNAARVADSLSTNISVAEETRKTLVHVFANDILSASTRELEQLELLLSENNVLLSELAQIYLPSCTQFMLKCRWRNEIVSCDNVFGRELTPWGVCCIMRPAQTINVTIHSKTKTTRLDVTLHCSNNPSQSCGFLTRFDLDNVEEPMVIVPGYDYLAQVRFVSVLQNSLGDLVETACNAKQDYNKANCLAKCAEEICGCRNPLHPGNYIGRLPPCRVNQLRCLATHQNDSLCYFLPSCNKVTTFVTLESGPMKVLDSVFDPMYSGINETSSVIHLKLYNKLSRIFTINPTESWLSLLSSLGGVFNMFLGVGLFSALELLFLLFVKLPIAFKNSAELVDPPIPSKY